MKKLIQIGGYLVVALFLIKACHRTTEVRSWPETPAIISGHTVENYFESQTSTDGTVKRGAGLDYRLSVSYQFQLDGVQYSGRFSKNVVDELRQVEQQQRNYPLGKKITVRYDPQNPADSEYKGF